MLVEQRNTNDPHPILHYPLIELNEKLQQVVAIGLLAQSLQFHSCSRSLYLKVEQLFHYPHGILRTFNTMPNCPSIFEDLIVVSTLEGFIAEEMDGRIVNTAKGLLCLQVLQAVSLVPASGKYVEGNLSAD